MKKWRLTIKTSLPEVCETPEDLKVKEEFFENFETAKEKMRETIKDLAFCENVLFDGNGYLKNFVNYISELEEYVRPLLSVVGCQKGQRYVRIRTLFLRGPQLFLQRNGTPAPEWNASLR